MWTRIKFKKLQDGKGFQRDTPGYLERDEAQDNFEQSKKRKV